MQINSANSYTSQSNVSLSVDNQNQVAEQRDRFRVQPASESTEQAQQSTQQSAQQIQEQNKQLQQAERFDIDEQALALVEQAQLESQQAQINQNSSQPSSQGIQPVSVQSGNSENGQGSREANYDSPSQQNQTAVAAYSSIGQIAQRENIQQVFGVDLFA